MKTLLAIFLFAAPAAAVSAEWPQADDYIAWSDCQTDQCRYSRQTWADEYAGATSGQYQGQRNVAFCLSTGCEGALKVNKILGCAWRFVIVESGHLSADASDAMNLKHYCGPENVDQVERATAEAQARTLLKMISNPAD